MKHSFIKPALMIAVLFATPVAASPAFAAVSLPGSSSNSGGQTGHASPGNVKSGASQENTVARTTRAQRIAACLSRVHDQFLDDLDFCHDRWPGKKNASNRLTCIALAQSNESIDSAECRSMR